MLTCYSYILWGPHWQNVDKKNISAWIPLITHRLQVTNNLDRRINYWNDLTWNHSITHILGNKTIIVYFLVCLVRKHGLNCHRMKPALFTVLCEIKEKTGEPFIVYIVYFSFHSSHSGDSYMLKLLQCIVKQTVHWPMVDFPLFHLFILSVKNS